MVSIPAYFVDPYNVFHWKNIRDNGVEPNKNYIKTKYIVNNPTKFDGFIFGSSRVGAIHVENIKDYHIYNMTYSAGTPNEHLRTLRTFIEEGVKMEIVCIGVDSLSYTEDSREHEKQALRCSYQHLQNPINFFLKYFDVAMIKQSIPVIKQKLRVENVEVFYEYGAGLPYVIIPKADWENELPFIGNAQLLEETLQDIREIKQLCDENEIKLIIFTNPLCEVTYRESVNRNYLVFLKELANITEYYNFSGLNNIALDADNFYDTSHYNAFVGDMIISAIFEDEVDETLYEQGFGWYVTSDNINELLELLQEKSK